MAAPVSYLWRTRWLFRFSAAMRTSLEHDHSDVMSCGTLFTCLSGCSCSWRDIASTRSAVGGAIAMAADVANPHNSPVMKICNPSRFETAEWRAVRFKTRGAIDSLINWIQFNFHLNSVSQHTAYVTHHYWECSILGQQWVYLKVTSGSHKKYAQIPQHTPHERQERMNEYILTNRVYRHNGHVTRC